MNMVPVCTCEPTGPEPWDHDPACDVWGQPTITLEAKHDSTYVVIHEGTIVETIIARGADAAFASRSQPGELYLRVGGQS